MDMIKMLWEKIDRESEWTWRYEVFRDNIMEYLPKEVVAEEFVSLKPWEYMKDENGNIITYRDEQRKLKKSETKKIELLQDHIMIDKDIARVLLPVEKKVNEIINTLNTLIK